MRQPRFSVFGLIAGLAVSAAAATAGDGRGFTLGLDQVRWPPVDPRTEARQARWNSPMGRLMYEFAQQQSALYQPGTPGGAQGLGVRIRLQRGLPLHLTAAMMNAGTELDEQDVRVVKWPWEKDHDTGEVRPLDEQISVLLGRRIESSR